MENYLDVLFIYRNFNNKPGTSHLGLGNNCLQTIIVLKKMGFFVRAIGTWEYDDIVKALDQYKENPPKYCVIEAIWVSLQNTLDLISRFPHIHFIVRCHSNISFLSCEAGAVILLREILLYSETNINLSLAGNSIDFCNFVEKVYHGNCIYLPNLYNLNRVEHKNKNFSSKHSHVLKAGSFGAIRLLKNHMAGASAALTLAHNLGKDLEFYITINRSEGSGASGVVDAINNLFVGSNWAKLIQVPWSSWSLFRRTVAEMDLCFHLSTTETFSLVTADALAENVGVVGSPMITWLPDKWKVSNLDNSEDAAKVGKNILFDKNTPKLCQQALSNICSKNEKQWNDFLTKEI